jgi:hypothetical protein
MPAGTHMNEHSAGIWKILKRWGAALCGWLIRASGASTTAHGRRQFFGTNEALRAAVTLSGPLVLQSAATSLVATPGDCRAGDEHTPTTAAQQQVRWRLIPAANDSPVVFHNTNRRERNAVTIKEDPTTR